LDLLDDSDKLRSVSLETGTVGCIGGDPRLSWKIGVAERRWDLVQGKQEFRKRWYLLLLLLL
jgi:hypothetical protein